MTGLSPRARLGPRRAVMALAMAALRGMQRRTRNAGFVDVCRAVGVAILAVVFAGGAGGGEPPRPDPPGARR